MSYYSRVKRDLSAAAAKNIITAEQEAALISHFEENRGFFSRMTLASWLGIAGGLFIAIGIILIVAFNWDKLGHFIKIAAYLMILSGTGYGFVKAESRPVLRIVLGIIWFFLPAAGIGLYAQIFQLSGTPIQPYFTWAVLSAPLALWGGGRAYSRMMSALLFFILFYGTFEQTSVFCIVPYSFHKEAADIWTLGMAAHLCAALALLAAALGINFYKKDSFSPAIAAALIWILVLISVPDNVFFADNPAMSISAAIAAAVLFMFYKMRGSMNEKLSFINFGIWIWAYILYMVSFMHGNHYAAAHYAGSGKGGWLGISAAAAIIVSAAMLCSRHKFIPESKNADYCAKLILILSMICPFIPSLLAAQHYTPAAAAANILLIAMGTLFLWGGSFYGSRKTLNKGMAIIVIVAITCFFNIFGSQLTSGMAFLATGGFFAFMAWWFSRGAARLAGISQEKSSAENLAFDGISGTEDKNE